MLFLFAQFSIDLIISTPNSSPSYWNLFSGCLPTSKLLSTFHLLELSSPDIPDLLQSGSLWIHEAPVILAHPLFVSYAVFTSHTFCVSSLPISQLTFHFYRDPGEGSTKGKFYKAKYIWKCLSFMFILDRYWGFTLNLGWISSSLRLETIASLSSSFQCQPWKISCSVNWSFLWLVFPPKHTQKILCSFLFAW